MNGVVRYNEKSMVPIVRIELRRDCIREADQVLSAYQQQRKEQKLPIPESCVVIEEIPEQAER